MELRPLSSLRLLVWQHFSSCPELLAFHLRGPGGPSRSSGRCLHFPLCSHLLVSEQAYFSSLTHWLFSFDFHCASISLNLLCPGLCSECTAALCPTARLLEGESSAASALHGLPTRWQLASLQPMAPAPARRGLAVDSARLTMKSGVFIFSKIVLIF